jgi:hypothetical protein
MKVRHSILKPTLLAAGLAAGLLAGTGPALAHHAVNSQFDVTRNVAMTGVMTKYELINPHSYIHFDVKGADGKVVAWSFETGAPASLRRAGLSARDAFKIGETYKFVVSPSRNGSPTGLLTAITLPTGQFIAFSAAQNVDAARELSK